MIGNEIGDGKVYLVADAADYGDSRTIDSPGDGFLVERPQVLQGAAAPGEDQHVTFPALIGFIDSLCDLLRRTFTLYRHRVDDDSGAGVAPPQDMDYVPYRGARG